jgi:hypothetical protein
MTASEESKLDRALEMLVRMDEKLTLGARQLADHETRLRSLETRPTIRWKDLGAIATGAAAISAVIIGVERVIA